MTLQKPSTLHESSGLVGRILAKTSSYYRPLKAVHSSHDVPPQYLHVARMVFPRIIVFFSLALIPLLHATVADAQPHPNCDDTCGGGIQPTNTGGDAIQKWTSISNQRGVGGPRTTTQRAGRSTHVEGSQSYTYAVPLFDIPGRGLNTHLTLYYNSLVWQLNTENGSMDYAANFDTPSPGFTLGFGGIDFSTDGAVGMLTEPTGAKHLLLLNGYPNYHTTDSSYIQVVYSTTNPVTATYKDGLKVSFQPFTVQVNGRTQYRPFQIEDTNGNYISITYNDPNDLNISTITDTVGRRIQFTYDSTGTMLQHVNLLDGAGQVFRQYTFSWAQNQTLTFNFTRQATAGLGLTPGYYTSGLSQSPNQINLLTKVTRPDGTSVVFDYMHDLNGVNANNPDWGIVKSIQEQSSNGTPRLTTSYLFPAASAGALTRNPTYTQQAVNDSVNIKTWTYQATTTAQGLVTSMVSTDPCGNAVTTTFSSAGDAIDGLPITEVMTSPQTPAGGCPTSAAATWRTANKTWVTDTDGSNPRPQTTSTVLEDATTQSQVTINSYDSFGQPTDVLEYNLGSNGPGPLSREVVTSYASLGSIVNRPAQVLIKNAAGVLVSRTDFAYDNYSTLALANISPNPAGHDSSYGTSFTTRGNLTSTSVYANASAGTGAITSTFSYDVRGNRLTSQVGCCTFSQQNFSSATDYAFPDSVVTGPSGNSLSLTNSFTYNLLTGTMASSTDPNNQTTSYAYDVDNRLITTTLPDGNTVSQAYDDASASPSVTTSNSFNSLVRVTSVAGPTVTEIVGNGTPVNYAPVSTKTVTADVLGRTISVSNPFGPNETQLYTTYTYDPIGRVKQVTPPGNTGSYTTSYGIESTSIDGTSHMIQTVTSADPAGKQRKRYTDGLGLRQVDEPGPSGGSAGTGSVSISGAEQSASVPNGGGATAGTGSVSVSGNERSTVVLTHAATPASVTVTIGGADTTNVYTVCVNNVCHSHSYPDGGTIQFTVNAGGATVGPVSVNYTGASTPASLAAALFSVFPANSVVTMSNPNGSASFTLTTVANGVSANSATITTAMASSCDQNSDFWACGGVGWTMTLSGPNLSPTTATTAGLTGGTDNVNTTMYDTGNVTVNVTINGAQYSKASTYGQNSSSVSIAADLANQINSDTTLNQLLVANSTNGVLGLTTVATGNGTNYPFSVTSATTSQYFSSGSTSFPASTSGSTLTPGQNGTIYDTGTVTVSITGFTEAPYSKTANYSQGSTPASIASSIAGAFNGDPLSPVTASSSSSSITFTAKQLGAETNYGVQIASATTQTAYFAQPSFTGTGGSLSGGLDPSISLSTPFSTTYNYDALGRLLQVNQGVQQRVYAYDNLGRLTSVKIPETLNQATTYTYTDFGAVYQKTDPRGIMTTTTYDALNRPGSISYSDSTPSVTYTYGGQAAPNFGGGRLTQVVDASGTTSFKYDLMGRQTQVSRAIGAQTYVTLYSYTGEHLDTVTYPSGRTVKVTPDAIGRLSQIGSNGTNLLTINSYNPAGEALGATYGNAMTASYSYNSQLQLATLVSGSSTAPVLNLTYNYGSQNNGQIQGITDAITPSQSTNYTYDALGRLQTAGTTDVTAPNTWKLEFSYDAFGNRLTEIPKAGTANMPFSEVSVDPASNRINGVQYDAAGNVTNDGVHSYTFNANNQITQVDGAGSFVYDGGERRVIKNGTVYIYEGRQVIAEYPNGAVPGSPSVEYVGNVASFAGGVTTYYFSDHQSIRALANAAGSVTGSQTQFPFGEMVTGLQTGTPTKWQFTTYEGDRGSGESGLDNAQARYYTSRFGRFTSVDPLAGSILNPQSLNKFAYADNDPKNEIDPLGMAGGRWTCLLLDYGDCAGGNGYAPGGGGWGDAQLLTNDSMHIFTDPFGPMVDPTRWNPLAEGEAAFDRQVALNSILNFLGVSSLKYTTNNGLQIFLTHAGEATAYYDSNGYLHFAVSEYGHWVSVLSSEFRDYIQSVPVTATLIAPVYNRWVGPTGTVAYIHKTRTLCVGAGVGATDGHNVSVGILPLGDVQNAEKILSGWSVAPGIQTSPAMGGTMIMNSSGSLGGPTIGTPGPAVTVTYSVCKPLAEWSSDLSSAFSTW
jgi:RHS repeat-associated protein